MSLNVLIVRPPGNKIIEILAEGVRLVDENMEFTVLESTDYRPRNQDSGINYIEEKDFSREKMTFLTKLQFFGMEILKGNFNLRKAKINAVNNFIQYTKQTYYSKLISKFDIINIQYLQHSSFDILDLVPSDKKIIISLWGSDVFRSLDEKVPKQKRSLDLADVITLHSEEMKTFFLNKYGEKYRDKVKMVLFGNSYKTIELIKKIKIKELFQFNLLNEIDVKSIVVRIGYNGDPGQQHGLVIDELIKLPESYRDKIHVIIQLTYGGTEEYRAGVVAKIKGTGIEHTIFRDFLSTIEVLEVAKRSDIYLNLRTTDSLNNSLIESLLFNKLVICGDWLPYQILTDQGCVFEKVASIFEIGLKLKSCIDNNCFLDSELKLNSEKVEKLVSNKYTGVVWSNIYNSFKEK